MRITKEFLVVLVGLAAFVGAILVAWWVAGGQVGILILVFVLGLLFAVAVRVLGGIILDTLESRD